MTSGVVWEYLVVEDISVHDLEEQLRLWGREGWELVQLFRGHATYEAVFKRPVSK
jgi:hypothetical protein